VHSSDPRHPYAELTNLLRFSTEPVPFDKVDWDRLYTRVTTACRAAAVEPPSTNGSHP
jgi:hypothetical protein